MGESGTKSIAQWVLSIVLLIGVIAAIALAVVILIKVNDNKTNTVNRKCRAIEGKSKYATVPKTLFHSQ